MASPKSIRENDDLLSPSQVAREMGVHRSTVHNWIKSGMLPTQRHGTFHAVARKDLRRFQSIYKVEE